MSRARESISFFRRFVSKPRQIGALAPSSQRLARALVQPLSKHDKPANILELGAGTGAVTKFIAPLIETEDRLDICEADKSLASHLKRTYLEDGPLGEAYLAGRVRLFDQFFQDIDGLLQYDFIISGLPLTSFKLREAREVLELVKQKAKPNCVFSYFEYIGIRGVLSVLRTGLNGRRFRYLSAYLSRQIDNYQIDRQSVLLNLPPAFARHLRFVARAAV